MHIKAIKSVAVIGYVTGNLGLGVLARNVISSLQSLGVAVTALDVDPGVGRARHDLRYEHLCVQRWSDLPHELTIWVLAPEALGHFALRESAVYLRPGVLNIALTMWELPVLPRHLAACVELFDIVVAQSDYIHHVMNNHASCVRTIPGKHFLDLPDNIKGNRKRFGLPDDGVVFACAFDPHSDVMRKNPTAVLRAFNDALGNESNAYLAIKVNAKTLPKASNPVVTQLVAHAASHPRVRVMTEVLDYRETLAFYASCDAYVSLHRAEGLGLGLMEAMALGKPAIATAWSGNMTFMSDSNSCLVGYQLVPVVASISAYRKNLQRSSVVWADPIVAEAAAWMRQLYDDPDLRLRIGSEAARASASYKAQAAQCEFLETIATIAHNWRLCGTDVRLMADRERRLAACQTALHPPLQHALGRAQDVYDRHIGWRFRRGASQ
jgi:glycosyltransferase involved in cell wall biosynthesis